MKKLTPAQAHAAQVRADRRAAALERREADVAGDNHRVAELFAKAKPQAGKKPAKANPAKVRKYAPWGAAEYQSAVATYLELFQAGNVNREEFIATHTAKYPRRSEGAVSYTVAHLRALDTECVAPTGTLVPAEGLVIAAYEAAPERFPQGAALVEARLAAALEGLV